MPRFWHQCRIAFRCLRVAAWLTVLVAIAVFLWCNQVGLPNFLKARLVATLAEHGVKLESSRMRLSLIHGLVAENVRVGQPQNAGGPEVFVRQLQLDLNFSALLHRRWQLDGLTLRGGKFTLPLSPTDTLSLSNLQTDLRFQAADTWSLDHFRADFAGIQIGLSGDLLHAPEALKWNLFAAHGAGQDQSLASVKIFCDALREIHFQGRPQLHLALFGDARDVHSITMRLNANASGVNTPWFAAQDFRADANLTVPFDAPTNTDAAWGFWTNLQPFRLAWSVRLGALRAEPLDTGAITFTGIWAAPKLSVTTLTAQVGTGKIEMKAALDVPTRTVEFTNDSNLDPHFLAAWLPVKARAELARIVCRQLPHLSAGGLFVLPAWDSPAEIWPDAIKNSLSVAGALNATNLEIRGATIDAVGANFSFAGLMLSVPDFTVVQGKTRLTVSGQESDVTKNFRFRLSGALDTASVCSFLTDSNAVKGLACLTLTEPLALSLEAAGNLRTPATVSATGQLALAHCAIRGQTVDRLTAGLSYSNLMVDFVRPQMSRAGGQQFFSADKLTLDILGEKLILTNGTGHIAPMVVGRAIGPETTEAMQPYEFLAVPDARVSGSIPLRHRPDGEILTDDADLRVDMVGFAPFRWRKFQTTAITGTFLWRKNLLIVTNIVSECYGGEAHGWGNFDVSPEIEGTDFSFLINGTNVDLHRMGLALWSPTNELEGALSGTMAVTHANSEDWRTWNGFGRAELHNGVLWNVPIFGLVSRGVNTVVPSLGNSRATDGTGVFTMTNGVIFTDALTIHTATMQVDYVGTVDLDEKVNARATAKLLRNTPVLGSFVSYVLWPVSKIFECRVTGQLDNPEIAPVFIPKILLAPLHPVRSVEELFAPPANEK